MMINAKECVGGYVYKSHNDGFHYEHTLKCQNSHRKENSEKIKENF